MCLVKSRQHPLYKPYTYSLSTKLRIQLHFCIRYSRAKSGAADSDCGVKLGAENSLSGFNHCVISSKTTVPVGGYIVVLAVAYGPVPGQQYR